MWGKFFKKLFLTLMNNIFLDKKKMILILTPLEDIHIMQSSLPTTIYVQNLSFFMSQISTSHNFFSIWPIYMVFMGDTDEVWNFLIPTKKG